MPANTADTAPTASLTESATDLVVAGSVAALAATLDRSGIPGKGDALPLLWHWIFFRPTAAQSSLGTDGHPQKGGFLPDLGLPRRMWAGGRLRFREPIIVGGEIARTSRVSNLADKSGRSGRLAFVTVQHEITQNGVMAIEEEQDIVYREPAAPGTPLPPPVEAPRDALWHRTIQPTPTLLFRYSALTFNAHRIHYDLPYATQVEGYPDLVVHGPLIATLLMELLVEHAAGRKISDYAFKAVRPTFAANVLHVHGKPADDGRTVELWATDHEGWTTMTAQATFA